MSKQLPSHTVFREGLGFGQLPKSFFEVNGNLSLVKCYCIFFPSLLPSVDPMTSHFFKSIC